MRTGSYFKLCPAIRISTSPDIICRKKILPGLAAGATLVFITTLGAYVIPALLGGKNQNMVGQFIVTAVNIFRDLPLAATITVALLGVIVAVLIVTNRAVGLERVWDSRGRLG